MGRIGRGGGRGAELSTTDNSILEGESKRQRQKMAYF